MTEVWIAGYRDDEGDSIYSIWKTKEDAEEALSRYQKSRDTFWLNLSKGQTEHLYIPDSTGDCVWSEPIEKYEDYLF